MEKEFKSVNYFETSVFGLPVDCARELGCARDHLLIANCLDFTDVEAQVTLSNLSPNILYYLPTFFHFFSKQV